MRLVLFFAALLLTLVFLTRARADGVMIAVDPIHGNGQPFLVMEPGHWHFSLTKTEENGTLYGLGRKFLNSKLSENCESGIGLVWLNDTNKLNGTHTNFLLSTECNLSKSMYLSVNHYSHGAALGIEPNKNNFGWNLIGIGYRF